MKGTILDSAVSTDGVRSVTVATDYGVLIGVWNGESPSLKATVFFELEFDPDPVPVPDFKTEFTATSPSPGNVVLVGMAEAWHDGVLDLRIGPALVQVEAPDAPTCGRWFAVKGRRLILFDTNL
jgi:hypothetical protein